MNEKELKRAVLFASALRRIAGPLKARFWEGYGKGLDTYRQYVKGLSPAAAQQHLAFLAHGEDEDLARCLFSLGYRSGYDGDFLDSSPQRFFSSPRSKTSPSTAA